MFFRSFYGSSEPDTPSHNDPIPSKPLRPQWVDSLHFSTDRGLRTELRLRQSARQWFNGVSLTVSSTVLPASPRVIKPGLAPLADDIHEEERERLFHVVLLDDDEHTYDYVVEMLQKLFLFSAKLAYQHAVEVDTAGRTIVITCERPQAEFARDQIQAYGADPRMPNSKGSMSAVLVPVEPVDVN